MNIILLEKVRKLGNVGDVVRVKNGYARNFLIPNKKALLATKSNIDFFESKKSEIQATNKEKSSLARELANKINDKIVIVVQQAGEDGRLYGSVHSGDIAKSLDDSEISKKQIVLHNPIKYIGIHTIEVDLYADVTAQLFINVARSNSEAKDAEKKFKRGEKVMEGPSTEALDVSNDNEDKEESLTENDVEKPVDSTQEQKDSAEEKQTA